MIRKWIFTFVLTLSPLLGEVKVVTWNVESPFAKLSTSGRRENKDLSAVITAYREIGGLAADENYVRTEIFRAVKGVIATTEWKQRVPYIRAQLQQLKDEGVGIFCLQEVYAGGLETLLEGTGLEGVTPIDVLKMPPWRFDTRGPRWNPDRFNDLAELGYKRPHTCAIVWDPERYQAVSYIIQPPHCSNKVFPAAHLTELDGEERTLCVASLHLSGYDVSRPVPHSSRGLAELKSALTAVEQMYLDWPHVQSTLLIIGMDGNFPKGEPTYTSSMKQHTGSWHQPAEEHYTCRNQQVGCTQLDHIWVMKPFGAVQLSSTAFPDHLRIDGQGNPLPHLRDTAPRLSDHRGVCVVID